MSRSVSSAAAGRGAFCAPGAKAQHFVPARFSCREPARGSEHRAHPAALQALQQVPHRRLCVGEHDRLGGTRVEQALERFRLGIARVCGEGAQPRQLAPVSGIRGGRALTGVE